MKINCPICKKETFWAEANPYRPFCSDRCKTIDLGEWASGKRFIPSDHVDNDNEEDEKPASPPKDSEHDE